jgi:hypothetical protein
MCDASDYAIGAVLS